MGTILKLKLRLIAALALPFAAVAAVPSSYQPPRHTLPASPLITGASRMEMELRADAGTQIERNRSPAAELEEHRKLDRALGALGPQRPGVVDAYLVSIALDSDPVFGREARAAGEILRRRYDAAGRTIVLAGSDGSGPSTFPRGTPGTLAIALARIAELMDRNEDVVVLYTTSHGVPFGLYYNDGDDGYGAISPVRLAAMFDELGLRNRLLILSACYAGIFVPKLGTDRSAVVTAASSDRPSFGCAAENDWTYFGDAMINHALRKPQPLAAAFAEANGLIADWETQGRDQPSQPQIFVGAGSAAWLDALERRIPPATQPAGRPAFNAARTAATRR
jgi:hypothetical protein